MLHYSWREIKYGILLLMKEKRYKTSIVLNGQKVIPSDVFENDTSRYILMDIFENDPGEPGAELVIMALRGPYVSQKFSINSTLFETFSIEDFERWIEEQKNNKI